MKKFAIKFYSVLAVLLLMVAYYCFCVAPKVSGDLGRLNLIPYGLDCDQNIDGMVDTANDSLCVTQCHDIDSLRNFPVLTIGDSFANQGMYSFPHFMGRNHGIEVANIERDHFYQPVQDAVALLNGDALAPGQTLIVEIVEHYYVWRLQYLDFESTELPVLGPVVQKSTGRDLLSECARWIRLRIGYNNPVKEFPLAEQCFSHPKYGRTLYVYREEMSFREISESDARAAVANLERLFTLAESKGVSLFFLVCADKYDSYEPWISGRHDSCNVLEWLPDDDRIIVMTPYMRKLIASGVRDVYPVNDGHTSTVGAALCADVVAERLGF